MMYYNNNGRWIFMVVGGLILLIIIILIIFALIRVFTHSGNSGNSGYTGYSKPSDSQQDPANRALAILAERYAKGEISDEEYRQKKAEITKP